MAPLDLGATLGNKLILYPQTTANSYGLGMQSSLLQMFAANSADIAFGTGSSTSFTELVRIKSSGNVGIGTTAPVVALQVIGDIRVGTSGTNGCLQKFSGLALTGTCSSDERLKTNIRPLGREPFGRLPDS